MRCLSFPAVIFLHILTGFYGDTRGPLTLTSVRQQLRTLHKCSIIQSLRQMQRMTESRYLLLQEVPHTCLSCASVPDSHIELNGPKFVPLV